MTDVFAERIERQLPELLVRARRGRSRKRLHRRDPESDEPRPACKPAQEDREYAFVSPAVYRGFLDERLCRNPGCFGGEQP